MFHNTEYFETTDVHVNEQELAEICHLTSDELNELLDFEVIDSINGASHPRIFHWDSARQLRDANAVRLDYDLDLFTVVIIMDYQRKMKVLQDHLQSLSQELADIKLHLQSST